VTPDPVGRVDPALDLGERSMLASFLDYHRATLLWKISDLTQEQLATNAVPTSSLTLAGLVKHLALVEDSWFTQRFAGQPMPAPFTTIDWDADPNWEFRTAAADSSAWLVQRYHEACERSRAVAAAADTLDAPSAERSRQKGVPFTLRWILMHMIEETARHNGQADLLREALDGTTGEQPHPFPQPRPPELATIRVAVRRESSQVRGFVAFI